MIIYNINFDIAALGINIVLLLLCYFRKTPPKHKNDYFRLMLLSNMLATVFDIMTAFTISFPQNYSLAVNYIVNILYYLFHNYSAFLFVMYGMSTDSKRADNPKIARTVFVIYAFVSLAIVTTPFTKAVFYFDENQIYSHGPLLYVLYAVALLCVVFVLYLKLTDKESQSTFQIVTHIVYAFALVAAFIYHTIDSSVLIELFAIDLGCLVMYVSLENPEQYYYKTMPVYNGQAFEGYVRYNTLRNKKFQVLIITPKEADFYKKIFSMNERFAFEKAILNRIEGEVKKTKLYVLDEFCYAMICSDCKAEAEKIDALLSDDIFVNGNEYICNMSYAVVRYPDVAANAGDFFVVLEDLVRRAGANLGNEIVEVDPNVLLVERRKGLEHILLDAVENNRFTVEYEPVFDIKTGSALNAEAKLVIIDGSNLIPMGNDLFKVAESSGLVADVDEIILRKVGEFIDQSNIQGLGIQNIIINLSVVELMNISFTNRVKEIIGKYKLPCKHICFKIIDFNLSVNGDVIRNNMNEMCALGFKFVVDKYGENSVNVSDILSLPVVGVKIGEGLTREAAVDEQKRIVLTGLVRILKDLDYSVALSNISDAAEKEMAKSTAVDFVQGPFYSRKMPAEDFVLFYKNQLKDLLDFFNRN